MIHKTSYAASYPQTRLRRLRQNDWLRDMVQEHNLTASDLIWPLFIIEGENIREPISSMPGIYRYSIDQAIEVTKEAADLGIPAIAVFPATPADKRTEDGRESYNPDNLICRATNALKNALPHVGTVNDVALDPYTSHGHDGLLEDGKIINDESVEILCKQALAQAQAGADIIAPSDMMDGRIAAIRKILDTNNLQNTCIMSYAAKYASGFYGPFRDAIASGNLLKGDKKTYQMNPANSAEAMREIALDIQEGADMVMIKPGLPYLDIIRDAKQNFNMPTFAYHVSGEYAMLKAAAQNGWLDYDKTMMETLLSFKRAGTDGILTYCALEAAKLLKS